MEKQNINDAIRKAMENYCLSSSFYDLQYWKRQVNTLMHLKFEEKRLYEKINKCKINRSYQIDVRMLNYWQKEIDKYTVQYNDLIARYYFD